MKQRMKEVAYDQPKPATGPGAARPEFVRAAVVPAADAPAVEPVPTVARPVGRRRMLSMVTGTLFALTLIVGGVGGLEYWKNDRQFEKVRTGAGQTISVEMPDGTAARLGPRSEVRYLKGMWSPSGPDRLVWPRGEVTFYVRKIEFKSRGGTKRLSLFRIATPNAWVTIRTDAQVKVQAREAETSVEMWEGAARIRRHMPDDTPVDDVIELPAGYGARTTATGVQVYPLPRNF